MPLYEEKLINPLAVRFSQDRIWPDFQDGTRIEDSLTQIKTVPLKGSTYDLVLKAPFPPMEIIRLKQELRDNDGERVRNEKGQRLLGEESWFTFDNRRLYCLQRSALQLWPMVVAVVVKVLYDFPEVRCARHKFRSTSDGCSVKISLPDGQPGSLWNWEEAAKAVRTIGEGMSAVLDAVSRDRSKHDRRVLTDVPPAALLAPGAREATIAERFNLGASRSAESSRGQVAGQQLLSILQGNASSPSAGMPGGLAALLAAPPQQQLHSGWQASEDSGWQDGGWQASEDSGWHASGSQGWASGKSRKGAGKASGGGGKGGKVGKSSSGGGKGGAGGCKGGGSSHAGLDHGEGNGKGHRHRRPKGSS